MEDTKTVATCSLMCFFLSLSQTPSSHPFKTVRLFLFAFVLLSMTASAQHAPFVLHNARIYTVNDAQPRVEAMAVDSGRVVALGSEEDVLSAYPGWERLDATGLTVVPGLIDAHAHLMGMGQSLLRVDLVGTTSIEDVVERLLAFQSTLPEEGWLTGRGWDQNDWGGDGAFPTRHDLDSAFPHRPVWISRVDGHAGWANSAAMRAAGINPDSLASASPDGGVILVDEQGRPSGVFVDAAEELIDSVLPQATDAELEEALTRALQETAKYGLTGVHEAGIGMDTLAVYRRFIAEGRFNIRNYAMIGGVGALFEMICVEGIIEGEGDRLWVRSLKLYGDGALGSRGAALLVDYVDDPGNRGLFQYEPAMFESMVRKAMQCGLQVNTHAIGDAANRAVLDAYEVAIQATGGGPGRHRIEHAQVVALNDIPRFAQLGVIASVQPTHATSDMPWAEDRVGSGRIRGAYAWRRFLDAGVRLPLGSDFPVERVSPLLGFYAAITRQDADGNPLNGWYPDQRLSREEALRGFTIEAAYASFMEDEVGSLEVGKWADFVILSKDIMTVPARAILDTHVEATYLGGELIYTFK